MDRGALQAAVHGVAKSQTRLSDFTNNIKLIQLTPLKLRRSCYLIKRVITAPMLEDGDGHLLRGTLPFSQC